jgi:hypothetical protein
LSDSASNEWQERCYDATKASHKISFGVFTSPTWCEVWTGSALYRLSYHDLLSAFGSSLRRSCAEPWVKGSTFCLPKRVFLKERKMLTPSVSPPIESTILWTLECCSHCNRGKLFISLTVHGCGQQHHGTMHYEEYE